MPQLLFSGMVENIEWRILNGQRLLTIRAILAGINLSNSELFSLSNTHNTLSMTPFLFYDLS